MLRAIVDWDSCQMCEPCEARLACVTRAVTKIDPDGPAWIEAARCNGCGDCLPACGYGAVGWSITSRKTHETLGEVSL
ncbi:MAG: hypothetical protein A2139_13500 [Desulfobacca sp. RBG_16_60_12]|nr:MAG: hypothetical protein A2139_13500 [Desulfobacca sp. RBG_16_60_12]